MTAAAVVVRRDDRGVMHVTLNRPETRNAFSDELVDQLTAAMVAAGKDESVRAVLLSGAGPCFCAGGDIEALRRMTSLSRSETEADSWRMDEMFRAVDDCACPVVAKVHKAARGGGVGLVACADIAIVTDDTTFAFSETRLGIVPAVVSTYALPKMQWSWARRLLITGEVFDAHMAERIGLVHEVVAADDLDERTEAALGEVLLSRPGAQRLMKAVLRDYLDQPSDRHQTSVRAVDAATEARMSDEGRAGLEEFLASRSGRRS